MPAARIRRPAIALGERCCRRKFAAVAVPVSSRRQAELLPRNIRDRHLLGNPRRRRREAQRTAADPPVPHVEPAEPVPTKTAPGRAEGRRSSPGRMPRDRPPLRFTSPPAAPISANVSGRSRSRRPTPGRRACAPPSRRARRTPGRARLHLRDNARPRDSSHPRQSRLFGMAGTLTPPPDPGKHWLFGYALPASTGGTCGSCWSETRHRRCWTSTPNGSY